MEERYTPITSVPTVKSGGVFVQVYRRLYTTDCSCSSCYYVTGHCGINKNTHKINSVDYSFLTYSPLHTKWQCALQKINYTTT